MTDTPHTDAVAAKLEELKVSGDAAAYALLYGCGKIERELRAALEEERQEHQSTLRLAAEAREREDALGVIASAARAFVEAERARLRAAARFLETGSIDDDMAHGNAIDAADNARIDLDEACD